MAATRPAAIDDTRRERSNPARDSVEALVDQAQRRGASHVHLVPRADGVAVLMRVRGALIEHLLLDPGEGALLTAAARRRSSTEEAIRCTASGDGARIVIRVDPRPGRKDLLAGLGMPQTVEQVLADALDGAGGLVLFAGTAGSGLSTSLQHAVAARDDGIRAVLEAPGQCGDAVLRDLLALDPDVLAIDGLADPAAATVAVEAARAGRLVLGAIRTAGAIAAIAALKAMRIAPFHIASVLRLAIGQRLAPRLCADCAEPVQGDKAVTARLGFEPGTILHRPKGCARCAYSGYRGVTPLFEAVVIDDPIQLLIDRGGDEAVIASHAFRETRNLASTARALALDGTITAEEAILISRPPDQPARPLADAAPAREGGR
ncbi:ATPase, T2SS/T4P/T4SS family [Sphingomonas parva]|nr:ATPase, T2SS/T4P/T4SS family [Sphingomonas parva]